MELLRTPVLWWYAERTQRNLDVSEWMRERERHTDDIRSQHERDGKCETCWANEPGPGWKFRYFPKQQGVVKACRLLDRQEILVYYMSRPCVSGWTPPHLLDMPEFHDLPLPLPSERPLTLAERFAVAAAIHDVVYKGVERIDPWSARPSPEDMKEAVLLLGASRVYAELVEEARRLPKSDAPPIDDILDDVLKGAADGDPDGDRKKDMNGQASSDSPQQSAPGSPTADAALEVETGRETGSTQIPQGERPHIRQPSHAHSLAYIGKTMGYDPRMIKSMIQGGDLPAKQVSRQRWIIDLTDRNPVEQEVLSDPPLPRKRCKEAASKAESRKVAQSPTK